MCLDSLTTAMLMCLDILSADAKFSFFTSAKSLLLAHFFSKCYHFHTQTLDLYLLTHMRVFGFGQKTPLSRDGCINHCNVGFP